MRELHEFIEAASSAGTHLRISESVEETTAHADEIFQLPLVSLIAIAVAYSSKGKIRTGELSHWAAAVICEQYKGLVGVGGRFSWSVTLRSRCADALVFGEATGLLLVANDDTRRVSLSEKGKAFVQRLLKDEQTEAGTLFRRVLRDYDNARAKNWEIL